MKFTPEFLDEIKARLPASQVIGARVKLKKQGREWRGLSPFNAEKTPPFYVNDQKQFFHDFSSGKHGNIFDFLIETEGLSFPEAVERLAREAGLDLPRRDAQTQARDKARASLHDVLALAADFFERCLSEPPGARARGYLSDRRIDAPVQRAFKLGFAPAEKFGLREALAAKGVDAGQMIEVGLLIHARASPCLRPVPEPRDVPDPRPRRQGGRLRRPRDGAGAKASTSIRRRPSFPQGRAALQPPSRPQGRARQGAVIAVEGYVDVIAMTEAGFPHTVAPLGTALTAEQCALLWTMAETPTLCFDGDKAGRKAAFRALETALPLIGPGKSFRFALLPEGQDPDDLAKSGGGEAIAAVLAEAKPFSEMLFLRETDAQMFDTPEARAGLERRLRDLTAASATRPCAATINKTWPSGCASCSAAPRREASRANFNPRRPSFRPNAPRTGVAHTPMPPIRLAERRPESQREIFILAGLLNHPRLIDAWAEEIAALEFSSSALAAFRSRLLDVALAADPEAGSLTQALAAAGLAAERERIVSLAGRMPSGWCIAESAVAIDVETGLRQSMALQRKSGAYIES